MKNPYMTPKQLPLPLSHPTLSPQEQEAQALAAISQILERLVRIETRLCKLMQFSNVDPSIDDGYRKR